MNRLLATLALAGAVLVVAPTALAAEGSPILRINALWVEPLDETTGQFDEDQITISADSAIGFEVDLEFMLSERFGLEGAIAYTSNDINGEVGGQSAKLADIDIMPVMLTANFHVIKSQTIDFYVGGGLAYVMYGDLDSIDEIDDVDDSVSISDDFSYQLNAGIDIGLGKNFIFTGGVRYLFTEAEIDEPDSEGPSSVGVDPLMIRAGIGFRF